jgi:hypothetical protein
LALFADTTSFGAAAQLRCRLAFCNVLSHPVRLMLYRLLRPLLFRLAPERAQTVAMSALRLLPDYRRVRDRRSLNAGSGFHALGLEFPNRIGLAAGFDKSARYLDQLGKLGFGFIEVGTVTPRPQLGHPTPNLFRLVEDRALINRMGFNNDGVWTVVRRLEKRRYRGVCGVNIGKNADTSGLIYEGPGLVSELIEQSAKHAGQYGESAGNDRCTSQGVP